MHTNFPYRKCPICGSEFTTYLRDIPAPYIKKNIPVLFCMDCSSLATPSGYSEDDERLKLDARWHLDVQERNTRFARNFLNAVRHQFPHVQSILEIGCGTGTLLEVARTEYNMRVIGYDTNPHAINLGLSQHKGINLIHDYWTAQSFEEKYDLVLCISIMEHLDQPMILMQEVAEYCKKHQSSAFISVPYFERDKWDLLLEQNPNDNPASDLRMAYAHVVHFTKRGLVAMAGRCGATSAVFFPRGWRGHWLEFS